MKNREVGPLYEGLQTCMNLKGVKFAFSVIKNNKKCESLVNSINNKIKKITDPSKEFMKYESERIKLAEKFAKKDKDGKAITILSYDSGNPREQYDLEDKKGFEKELKILKKEYSEPIDEQDKKIKKAQDLLEEEARIELHMISSEDVPQDITPAQLQAIEPIIK